MKNVDVVIIGGGPTGCALACYLIKGGLTVTIYEQQKFPRHQIGESLLAGSINIMRDIGVLSKIETFGFPLKPGAFFHSQKTLKSAFFSFQAALHDNPGFSYQVRREDFDKILIEHAASMGATVHQPRKAEHIEKHRDFVIVNQETKAKLLIHANGIGHAKSIPENFVENAPDDKMTAIFSYFKADFSNFKEYGSIIVNLFYPQVSNELSWTWCIPLSPTEASVGCVLKSTAFQKIAQEQTNIEKTGLDLLRENPYILQYIDLQKQLRHFEYRHNFQRVAKQIVFDREILIGDSAGFIDPVFSSGVHLGFGSAKKAAKIILEKIHTTDLSREDLLTYETEYRHDFNLYYRFVKLFYQRNIVENIFLTPENLDDAMYHEKIKEVTSILSGDLREPNAMLTMTKNAKLNINPEVLPYLV